MKIRWMAPLALVLPVVLTACGKSSTGPGAGTQITDVAQVYEVCTLAFVPEGAQPTVDLRVRAFETENEAVARPQLRIDTSGELQLVYTPREQFVQQDVRGAARMYGARVGLEFDQRGTRNPSALLLPDLLLMEFSDSPRTLHLDASPRYSVPRATYAGLAGISESGLAEQIPGTLRATFRHGSCG